MSIKCRIWFDTSLDSYVVSSSYSDKLVSSLKQFIPSGSRDFDPTTKFWYIKEQYGEFVRQVAESAFGVGSVSFTSKNVASQSQQQQQSGPRTYSSTWSNAGAAPLTTTEPHSTEDCLIAFMNLVPYEAAKKCYLATTQVYHPDKPTATADAQKMSRLNQLWERIEKEFYKR